MRDEGEIFLHDFENSEKPLNSAQRQSQIDFQVDSDMTSSQPHGPQSMEQTIKQEQYLDQPRDSASQVINMSNWPITKSQEFEED